MMNRADWRRVWPAFLLWTVLIGFVLMAFFMPLLFKGMLGPWGQSQGWAG